MRPFAPLLVALLALAAPARAQWTVEAPTPTHVDLRGVGAPTPTRVFVAAEDYSFDQSGALYESTDGGQTWAQLNVPADGFSPFYGIFFLDAQRGWAYGNENVRTTDGGDTWESLGFLGSTYHMEFFTPTFGVASTNGGLSVSRDGGLTWTDSPDGLYDFSFADGQVGLGVSASGLYRTADGGATFTLVRAGTASAVVFLTPQVAVAVVGDEFVRSTDGGLTWIAAGPAAGRTRLERVANTAALAWNETFLYPNGDGAVQRTADGGQTWTDAGTPFPGGVEGFAVPTDGTVVALGGGGDVYRSTDAGATWARVFASPGPRPGYLSDAFPVFADAQTGYVAYGNGFVARTTDGGATWAQVSSGLGSDLQDVARFDDGTLVAVGSGGTALTRPPGAARWTVRPVPTALALVAVEVIGPSSAVAVDADGRVYRTDSRGATWTAAAGVPEVGFEATDVRFTSGLDGYVVGASFGESALYRTDDGGQTWQPVEGPAGVWTTVDAEGPVVIAGNVGGLLHVSADFGETWTAVSLPDESGFLTLADIEMADETMGYAVGQFGYAARTTDGGQSWTQLPTPNEEDNFTDLYVVGPDEVWAATRDDKVYYTANGGLGWAVLPLGAGTFADAYRAVVATPEGEAWAVGYQGRIRHFEGPPPPPANRPPVASFSYSTNRLTVAFADQSTDPDGQVVSYLWEFDAVNGGATSTERNPTYTFPEAGSYIVRLTVTDDDGAEGVGGRFIVVSPGPGGTFGGFTEVTPFESPFVTPQDEDFWVTTAAPADVDRDGDLDMAVLGFYVVYNESVEDRLLVFRNDGPAAADEWAFASTEVPLGSLTAGASDMAWGDADGDGDDDLAVGTDGATVLYRNDDGALVATATALPGYYEDNDQADFDLRSLSWADTDNDGDLDLLVPSVFDFDETFEFRTALMRNDGPDGAGGWTFTEVADAGIAPTRHAQSAWADADDDGDLDLLLVNVAPLGDEGFIRIYTNNGDHTFTGADILDGLTVEHGEAQWGDAEGDGDLDVLVAGNLGEPDGTFTAAALRVYVNDGGAYTRTDVVEDPAADGWYDLTAATWADVDSDGDVDILLTGSHNPDSQIEGRARIFVNEGGVFADTNEDLPAPQAGGTRGGTFSWMDLDGEGDLDYFVAGEYFVPGGDGLIEAQMHVYRNDAVGQNAAPGPPADVTVVPGGTGGAVTLTWEPAADDTTPADALTYTLELRRDGAPGAEARRLPEPGALGAVGRWALDGLADGTYTYTLRAVDSAFNGGTAATGTFTVGAVGTEGDGPLVTALAPAFPNPLRDRATVRFTLARPGPVALDVYDVLGRRVATLADGAWPAGAHEVRWDASSVAAGAYVVRLTSGEAALTQRVTVVR